ncbi:MAG: AraC family transcriptional regulator, partial [Bacteroidota bacterium]
MNQTIAFHSLTEAHKILGLEAPKHPLVSVFRHTELSSFLNFQDVQLQTHFYSIGMKDGATGKMGYGQNCYDYTEGT